MSLAIRKITYSHVCVCIIITIIMMLFNIGLHHCPFIFLFSFEYLYINKYTAIIINDENESSISDNVVIRLEMITVLVIGLIHTVIN